jgi:hypothetical protein
MSMDRRSERRRRRAMRPRRAVERLRPHPTIWPATERTEAIVAEDPDLRNYLRAPYDPSYGAQVGRFFTRGVLQAAEGGGWRRLGALVVALMTLIGTIAGLTTVIDAVTLRRGEWIVMLAQGLLILLMNAPLCAALLWRLGYPQGRGQILR